MAWGNSLSWRREVMMEEEAKYVHLGQGVRVGTRQHIDEIESKAG